MFTVAGVCCAAATYVDSVLSWRGCYSHPDPGDMLELDVRVIGAFVVMPTVAAVESGLAVAAHALLRRSVRRSNLSDLVPALIAVTGVITLMAMTGAWIAMENPGDVYCGPGNP